MSTSIAANHPFGAVERILLAEMLLLWKGIGAFVRLHPGRCPERLRLNRFRAPPVSWAGSPRAEPAIFWLSAEKMPD